MMIRFERLGLDEARRALAPMVGDPKWDHAGGALGVDDIIGGGVAYMANDECGPLVIVVLARVEYQGGRELLVRAAYGVGNARDATERVLPEIERQFGAGFDAVTMYTRRPGLMRKLATQGYDQAAVKMRKALK